MNAELITIGDEILIGQIVDSNSAWMAQHLNDVGISVSQISSISDSRDHILEALELASKRADIILITGGLGPTKDDITKSTLCTYFKTELKMNDEVLKHVKYLFDSFGSELLEVNKKQAEVPANCEVLMNYKGTAPGMWFEHAGKIYVSIPGVPYEMKALMRKQVIPKLQKIFKLPYIVHKTILTQGVGESFLAEKISDWQDSLEKEAIKLAYLPSAGTVRLRLSTSGDDKNELLEKVERKAEELDGLIHSYIYGKEDDTLERVVGKLLTESNRTLSTAESCTGGYIAHLITSIAGSSSYFIGSVIAYSNSIKQQELQVDPRTIEEHGAVSEEVVKAMAEGIRRRYDTDYAISCSGIAGPDGGTEGKPVGSVWICVSSDKSVKAKLFQFGPNRKGTIHMTALTALNMLRNLVTEEHL
ncbi:MAG TPA: competence/damage-inducible protein A [Flavobacteriales bacterium]|nr:competence/damage-inducible protein A [Flavobacteriales bacterium]HIO67342.1 competence/damage-inducible protein A [Flavobacteriales bacterium]